ncbi:type II secretion system protein GspC [Pseudoalteromonas xiamenensis]|uniref:Type II secretion system protein GspC n=1 Tax=Pseudoalteromonas xiamenensis TaxID=882626 RepID=A0A975HM90_9GAMM|nr:type II secretion system protein GspC [Pseudoalteromonas xiamenensis]QTH72893.1 type II secretion system protein GspC [Pseudoalteromonas xiamenensis]
MEQQILQLQKVAQSLPHKRLSKIVTIAAVVYVAYLTAQLFWILWPTPKAESLPSIQAASSSSHSPVNVRKILAQNLFGQANAVAEPVQKTVISDAPETRLSLRLTGIVAVSQDDEAGLAIIESQGRQETYVVKDSIAGTRAKLAQVLPDRVILDVSGRFETLMLDGLDFSKTVTLPSSTKRNNPLVSSSGPVQSKGALKEQISATREEVKQDPGKLFDYIRISQATQDGKLIGYRLSAGKDPALFSRMGLKNNDLAVAINGYQLTDMKQAMQAVNELRTSSNATITIERDGSLMDVQFSL